MLNKRLFQATVGGAFAMVLMFGSASPTMAQGGEPKVETKQTDSAAMRKKVDALFAAKSYTEAVPLLAILVKDAPEDAELRFLYGIALLGKSKQVDDPDLGMLFSSQALAEFKKAKELGVPDDAKETLDEFIALLSTDATSDGAGSKYSKNPEANKYMTQAEGFFARSDYDKAFELYQKALAADPSIYEAALYSGDVMLQRTEFDEAEKWYQKAIAINPNRETAYRYSATPLMKQKKYDKALERYIEAYITEPYNNLAVGGLVQWGRVTDSQLRHPKFSIPKFKIGLDGKSSSTININPLADDGSMAWIGYTATRTEWYETKFKAAFPNEKTYRHTLREEAEALRSVLRLADDLKGKSKNPEFEVMRKLDKEGLLEAFILMAIADEGIQKDHAAYLAANRAKLREYVNKYVVEK